MIIVICSMGKLDQMRFVALSMDGAQLRYKDLIADNGMSLGTRS